MVCQFAERDFRCRNSRKGELLRCRHKRCEERRKRKLPWIIEATVAMWTRRMWEELRFRSRTCFEKDAAGKAERQRQGLSKKRLQQITFSDHHRRLPSSDPCVRVTLLGTNVLSGSPLSQTHSFLVTWQGQHGAFGALLQGSHFGVFDLNFIQAVEWYELTRIFKPNPVWSMSCELKLI